MRLGPSSERFLDVTLLAFGIVGTMSYGVAEAVGDYRAPVALGGSAVVALGVGWADMSEQRAGDDRRGAAPGASRRLLRLRWWLEGVAALLGAFAVLALLFGEVEQAAYQAVVFAIVVVGRIVSVRLGLEA